MADRLTDYSWNRGNSDYPWDEWLDGSVWRVQKDELGDVKLSSFINTGRARAKAAGLKLRTRTEGNGDAVVIQATSPAS